MKAPGNQSDDGQWVYLDPFLIDRRRINAGWSRSQLVDKTGVMMNTLKAAFTGAGVRASTAKVLATKLGCEVTDLVQRQMMCAGF